MQAIIEAAWNNRELLKEKNTLNAIHEIIDQLDNGTLRVAQPLAAGNWQVNEWVKKAVILYFPTRKMTTMEVGPFEFYDKMSLKTNYEKLGVRVVPPAAARYGAFLASGVIMMPSYVNIGAYVDSGTMVDTWATVGSCAQIGKNVHLSGGVGIGDGCGHLRGPKHASRAGWRCGGTDLEPDASEFVSNHPVTQCGDNRGVRGTTGHDTT